MKYINYFIIVLLLLFGISNAFAVAPSLGTLPVSWIGFNSASLLGNITSLGAEPNGTVYFQYREIDDVAWINSTQTKVVNETGEVSLNIFNLASNTNFTYRVVISVDVEVEAINTENFTTYKSPTIVYNSVSDLDTDSVTFIMNLTDLGNETNVTTYVECYDSEDTLYTTNESAERITELGLISINLTDLTASESYSCTGVADFDFGGEIFQVYTESVTITTDSIAVIEESATSEGINGIKSTLFIAFSLFGIIILVTIAMLLVAIFQDGAAVMELLTISVWAIGAAIIVILAFVIINAVVNVLIMI